MYLGTLFEEVLSADTYANGQGSQVRTVIDGSLHGLSLTGMAGVANIGTDRNWTGHPFGQANWYAYGRLAWTSVYYHRADSTGIGFDRSTSGSGAVSQYHKPVQQQFNDIEKIPERYLLWFHHADWDYELDSGRSLWEGLVHHYYSGVDSVRWIQDTWESVQGHIDGERYHHVAKLLEIQEKEAEFWRDACLLYFQQFSDRPIPDQYPKPEHSLEYYKNPLNKYVPGL